MKAISFAPGHVSGFFEPIYRKHDTDRSGSRGSGINVSLGAVSETIVESSFKQNINVYVNNKLSNAPVTKLAIKHLIGETPLNITVNTKLDLPVGQGFGMSGAGALSATTSLAKLLKIPKERAIKTSHYAEVQLRTGLGDVIASSFGGIEIRREAGLPPWGMIEHIPGKYDVVLCVIGKKMDTKKILFNSAKINEISSYGRYCTKKILQNPSVENLFSLSQMFTIKTGLADKKVIEAIKSANHHGMSSMCMLGNSVFAIGDTKMLYETLSAFGKTYVCSVDKHGAQFLRER
ncbi:MAG: pantoate kinase [Petrotogales bacterium]